MPARDSWEERSAARPRATHHRDRGAPRGLDRRELRRPAGGSDAARVPRSRHAAGRGRAGRHPVRQRHARARRGHGGADDHPARGRLAGRALGGDAGARPGRPAGDGRRARSPPGWSALAAHAFIDLDWTTALLLGAAVSSTDAAAVFAALRGTHVRRRLAAVLEAESGLNDPFAALLVIGLVQWSTSDFGHGRRPAAARPPGRHRGARRACGRRRGRVAAAPAAVALGRARPGDHRRRRPGRRRGRLGAGRLGAARRVPHRPRDRRRAHPARGGRPRIPAGRAPGSRNSGCSSCSACS